MIASTRKEEMVVDSKMTLTQMNLEAIRQIREANLEHAQRLLDRAINLTVPLDFDPSSTICSSRSASRPISPKSMMNNAWTGSPSSTIRLGAACCGSVHQEYAANIGPLKLYASAFSVFPVVEKQQESRASNAEIGSSTMSTEGVYSEEDTAWIAVLFYNLALAQHLVGLTELNEESSSSERLRPQKPDEACLLEDALLTYQLVFSFLHNVQKISPCAAQWIEWAVLNNCAHIYNFIGNTAEASVCLSLLGDSLRFTDKKTNTDLFSIADPQSVACFATNSAIKA